jgi:hypothetical protein
MSDNTLNKALGTWAAILAPAATTARSTASTLLNEEGAFDGDVVAQFAHETEKKAPAARRGGAAPA